MLSKWSQHDLDILEMTKLQEQRRRDQQLLSNQEPREAAKSLSQIVLEIMKGGKCCQSLRYCDEVRIDLSINEAVHEACIQLGYSEEEWVGALQMKGDQMDIIIEYYGQGEDYES